MRALLHTPADVADRIRRNQDSADGKPKPIPLFAVVARTVWPEKTDQHLASIARSSDRAARFWLSGKVPPPAAVAAAMMAKIFPPPE